MIVSRKYLNGVLLGLDLVDNTQASHRFQSASKNYSVNESKNMTQYSIKLRNEMRFRHQAANHSLRLCQRLVGTPELLAGKLFTLLLTSVVCA